MDLPGTLRNLPETLGPVLLRRLIELLPGDYKEEKPLRRSATGEEAKNRRFCGRFRLLRLSKRQPSITESQRRVAPMPLVFEREFFRAGNRQLCGSFAGPPSTCHVD
jgi:hypothetical protein